MTSYCYLVRGAEFAALAQLSIVSVRRVDRDARVFVFTDEEKPDWEIADAALGYVTPGRPAMVSNLDAQIAMLGTAQYGDRVLFLDADTLMQSPFPWEPEADLYVTWRDHVNGNHEAAKAQPYNYGVLGAVASIRTLEAFIWLRARILQMAPKNQAWYGNQLALADLLGAARNEYWTARVRWTLTDDGTALGVRPLPCEQWNYSPSEAYEDITGRGIIHLKGDRKDLIDHYAKRLAT